MHTWRKFTWTVVGAAALVAAACGARTAPITVVPIPPIDMAAQHSRVFEAAWAAVRDRYVQVDLGGVDWESVGNAYRPVMAAAPSEDDFANLMREMLAKLPQNQATFQTRGARLAQAVEDSTVYSGVGAFIAYRAKPEPHVVILAVVADSPAEKAGLDDHDSIYAVDGVPFTGADEAAPAGRIRGLGGSTVTLTVKTPGTPKREVKITREQIQAVDVLRGGHLRSLDVAYYRVPVAADADMAQLIAENLTNANSRATLNGVILDLRVARTNSAWPLQDMLALFGDGAAGEFYSRDSVQPLEITGADQGGSQTLPLVILIGPDTEGTPEIFAAALQSSKRAVLVGMATPGAVEGFTEVSLPDGSRMFLATSSFRTERNVDLADQGLKPDVTIDADWDSFTSDDDAALDTAIGMLVNGA